MIPPNNKPHLHLNFLSHTSSIRSFEGGGGATQLSSDYHILEVLEVRLCLYKIEFDLHATSEAVSLYAPIKRH